MGECLLEDKACWQSLECSPTDFVCQSFKRNPQVFEYVLGGECRDGECNVKGRYLSELTFPVLKACSDEANGDGARFSDCLLDIADIIDEVPKFMDSLKVQSIAHQAGSHEAGKVHKPRKGAEQEKEGGSSTRVYVDKRAQELYGPFPEPPCEPKDYACISYHYPELHRYAVGTEGCFDAQCGKRGFRPAWILWPVLKACGEEASGDKQKFYSCVRGVSSLLRTIAQQFK
jgi:hypothetical protein